MKPVRSVLALTLTLALASTPATPLLAQAASNSATAAANAHSYRLLWAIDEFEAGKPIGKQHFSMIVTVDGGPTSTKIGSKIPVATGSYSGTGNAAVQTQFQYLDVGLNIDSSLDQTAGGLRLHAKIEQSSVAQEKVTVADVVEPIIRQAVVQVTSLLTLGKTITLGSLDVPGSTHHLEIAVTAEEIK